MSPPRPSGWPSAVRRLGHLDPESPLERGDVLGSAEDERGERVQPRELGRAPAGGRRRGGRRGRRTRRSRRRGVDEEGGALPAAGVPAGGVPGEDGREEPLVEGAAGGREEGVLHRVDDLRAGEDVALHGVGGRRVTGGAPPGPREALVTGEGRRAVAADGAHLAQGPAVVTGGGGAKGVADRRAVGEGVEDLVAVRPPGEGLGGDGPHADPHRRDDRADGDELAGDRDAPGVAVVSGDREGHGGTVGRAGDGLGPQRRSSRTAVSRCVVCGNMSKTRACTGRHDGIAARSRARLPRWQLE